MATINDIQIWVQDEKFGNGVESTEHPVEKGIDITDHVKENPITLDISGEIVGKAAEEKKAKINALMKKGSLITYVGRNTLVNAQIQSFNTSYSSDIWGGFSFDMQIKQVKIAKPAYQSNPVTASRKSVSMKQIEKNAKKGMPIIHTVKKGDTCWDLAQKYNTTVAEINKYNDLLAVTTTGAWNTLKIGAHLVVGKR